MKKQSNGTPGSTAGSTAGGQVQYHPNGFTKPGDPLPKGSDLDASLCELNVALDRLGHVSDTLYNRLGRVRNMSQLKSSENAKSEPEEAVERSPLTSEILRLLGRVQITTNQLCLLEETLDL